jgi:hypothetical protein
MRGLADSTRIKRFMRELGRSVDVDGRVYSAAVQPRSCTDPPRGKLSFHQFEAIEPELYRFPAIDIDPHSFREAVGSLLAE